MSNKSIKRATPVLINGAITLLIAWPLAHKIGIVSAIDALTLAAGEFGLAVAALWYALVFIALAALLRATAMLSGLHFLSGNVAIDRLGQSLATPVRSVFAFIAELVRAAILVPVRVAWNALWRPIEDRLFQMANRLEIERQLRAEYRTNFRTQYRSFAEFKRAYYADEEPEPATPQSDALSEALALLGLSADCTKEQLELQHRTLMKRVHPDLGGTAALAARLNEARDIVRNRKGWK